MIIKKRRSKKLKKLEEEHTYLDKKVSQLTKDRRKDRSSEGKDILSRQGYQVESIKSSLPEAELIEKIR